MLMREKSAPENQEIPDEHLPGIQLLGAQNLGCMGDLAGLSLPHFPATKGDTPDPSKKEARSQGRAQGDF